MTDARPGAKKCPKNFTKNFCREKKKLKIENLTKEKAPTGGYFQKFFKLLEYISHLSEYITNLYLYHP